MPMRCAAASRGTCVPSVNVCAPWRSACISWAARSSARASSVVRSILCLLSCQHPTLQVALSVLLRNVGGGRAGLCRFPGTRLLETVWKLAKGSRWYVFGGATGQRLSFFTPFYRLVGLQFDAYPDFPNSLSSLRFNPRGPV